MKAHGLRARKKVKNHCLRLIPLRSRQALRNCLVRQRIIR